MSAQVDVLAELGSYEVRTDRPPVPTALREALRVLGHGDDYVASVDVDEEDGVCRVQVEWYIRGCHQGDDLDIPLSVLTAADVTQAAKLWKAETRVTKARELVADRDRSLLWAKEDLAKATEALASLAGAAQ